MRLSIVIPVYNVEKYLERCIKSCISQGVDNNDYELIIVNDGSTDNSLHIAERFADSTPNITLISQPNGGLSAARNKGLSIAKGEYIWFIDSDDWIAKDSIATIIKVIDDCSPTIMMFYGANVKSDDETCAVKRLSQEIRGKYTGHDLFNNYKWETCVPFYVYNREYLINGKFCFMTGIYHEDNEFTPRILTLTDNIYVISKTLYYVYQNPNSITRTVNSKKAYDLITVAESLTTFTEKHIKDKHTRKNLYNFISLTINTALHQTQFMSEEVSSNFLEYLKQKKHILKGMTKANNPKYRIQGFLINCSLPLYYRLHIKITKK